MTDFILPSDLADKFARFGEHVRAAPASEALTAFGLFAASVAGLIGSRLPQVEAIDRLQAFAEGVGLVAAHGDDTIQEILAHSFENPILSDADFDEFDKDAQRAPEFSDEAIALRFAEQHAARLRYVAPWADGFSGVGHIGAPTIRSTYSTRRGISADKLRANAKMRSPPSLGCQRKNGSRLGTSGARRSAPCSSRRGMGCGPMGSEHAGWRDRPSYSEDAPTCGR